MRVFSAAPLVVIATCALALAGCQATSKTDRALVGGAAGALTGAVIGGSSGSIKKALKGAAIGGAAGGLAGAATAPQIVIRQPQATQNQCVLIDADGKHIPVTCP